MWIINPWRRVREIQVILTEVVNNQNELTKLQNKRMELMSSRIKDLEFFIRNNQ